MEQFQTFVEVLRYRGMHQPDEVAFVFLPDGEVGTETLTYQQLDRQAQAIAEQLPLAVGDRVLLLYPQGLEFIKAFFGCLYAGVVAVPVAITYKDPAKDQQILSAIAADTQAQVALTSGPFAQHLDLSALQVISTSAIALGAKDAQTDTESTLPQLGSEQLAFLQYTSGSTGRPKGVMITHQNLLQNIKIIELATGGGQQRSTVVSWLPFYHDMGLIGSILQPIYSQDRAVIMPPVAFLQKPMRWLQAISHYQATTSGGPNFAYDLCLIKSTPEQRSQLDLSAWKVAFTGAEAVNPDTIDRFSQAFTASGFKRTAFYPCYGMAEATLMISGSEREQVPAEIAVSLSALENHQVVEVADATKGAGTARRIIGCGQGWLDQSIQIVDPQTYIPRVVDQVGEIWVSGTSIAQGYWQQPEATQATFRGYLANSDRRPFLRTGDLGFIHKGELFITGRLKDMVIIRGRNHYPQDIEATVQQSHPALIPNACAAFGVEIEGHERLAIAQEVASPDTLDLAEVAKAIRQQIYQRHGLPTYGIVLLAMGSLPKTASQKIQRSACQKGFLAGTLDPLYEDTVPVVFAEVALSPVALEYPSLEAGTDNQPILQSWLVHRLAVALQQPAEQIDSTESFAIYGIDSSVAVSITSELSEWLHQDLDPMIFWEYPSIEKLSHYLSEACLASPITTTL